MWQQQQNDTIRLNPKNLIRCTIFAIYPESLSCSYAHDVTMSRGPEPRFLLAWKVGTSRGLVARKLPTTARRPKNDGKLFVSPVFQSPPYPEWSGFYISNLLALFVRSKTLCSSFVFVADNRNYRKVGFHRNLVASLRVPQQSPYFRYHGPLFRYWIYFKLFEVSC